MNIFSNVDFNGNTVNRIVIGGGVASGIPGALKYADNTLYYWGRNSEGTMGWVPCTGGGGTGPAQTVNGRFWMQKGSSTAVSGENYTTPVAAEDEETTGGIKIDYIKDKYQLRFIRMTGINDEGSGTTTGTMINVDLGIGDAITNAFKNMSYSQDFNSSELDSNGAINIKHQLKSEYVSISVFILYRDKYEEMLCDKTIIDQNVIRLRFTCNGAAGTQGRTQHRVVVFKGNPPQSVLLGHEYTGELSQYLKGDVSTKFTDDSGE